jgi:hypothetical protein
MIGVVAAFGFGVWMGALANSRTGSIALAVASFGAAVAGISILVFPAWFNRVAKAKL